MDAVVGRDAKVTAALRAEKAIQSACLMRARTSTFRLLRPDGAPMPNWHVYYGHNWKKAREAAYVRARDVSNLRFRSLTENANKEVCSGINTLSADQHFKLELRSLEIDVRGEIFAKIGNRECIEVKRDALLCMLLAIRYAAVRNAGLIRDNEVSAYIPSMLAVWSKGYGTCFDINGSPIVYTLQEKKHIVMIDDMRQGGV